jgi:hypothetical protein
MIGYSASAIQQTPQLINSRTTYGQDTSAANNYGLGKRYKNTKALQLGRRKQSATPSAWWVIGAILVWAVLL